MKHISFNNYEHILNYVCKEGLSMCVVIVDYVGELIVKLQSNIVKIQNDTDDVRK